MTQGNNPKNKNQKQGGDPRKRSAPVVDRSFTAKSRVRSGGRGAESESEARPASGGGGSRAAERKQEREQERQRRRIVGAAVVIGAVALLVIFALLITSIPVDAPVPENAVTRYEGLQQTVTQDGYPQLGNPNAPVRVAVYSSFDCTHCREFHDGYQQALVDRARAGGISLVFVPLYGTGSVTNGEGAGRSALCAAQQGKFWAFQDALFNWQGLYGNQAFTANRLQSGAGTLGVDLRNGCVTSGTTTDVLTRARTAATNLLNYTGTPTITINGVVPTDNDQVPITDRDALIAAIDAEIARLGGNVTAQAEVTPEATPEATPETTPEAAAVEATPEPTAEATTES